MAQYKVGNKYLNDDEYALHAFEVWSFWLFVIGAFIAGAFTLDHLPEDWSKELRYAIVIGAGAAAGFALGAMALYIRLIFFIGIFLAGVSGALYWVWTIV